MIKVICGEDTTAARDYFNRLKKSFDQNQYQIVEINNSNLDKILSQIDSNLTLFQQKIIYFGQFISQTLKKNKSMLKRLKKMHMNKQIPIFIYEDKKKYDLTIYKDLEIIEFKLNKDIFYLLDLFLPGKKSEFLQLYHQIINEKNVDLFFYLLTKRVRDLLTIKNGGKPEKILLWQFKKLKNQANSWKEESLISTYQSLFRIEIDRKTSQTPFSLEESLDIFAYYHLS